jgi:hypothetical protein
MKRIILVVGLWLLAFGYLSAQTLNVQVGDVKYLFPASQTGVMSYADGTTLDVMGKVFVLSEIDSMWIDETAVTDNSVQVAYSNNKTDVTVAGNIAKYLTIDQSGAHVSIVQSEEVAVEITYTLSGTSADGSFYNSGAYKATVELNNLTLTNVSAVYSGAAVHIQNSKRIKIKPLNGTTNTLVDAVGGSQKGCLYIKGHAEFAQKGTLNITGNVKHGIKTGEYFTIKNSTVNILSTVGDGINCEQFFLMESGKITLSNVGDDGLQCDIEDPETGATGITADHEDEDTGNIYISGGTFTANVTADAAKGMKSEGDMYISGGEIAVTTSGGGVWDATNLKAKAASCLSADGVMDISGGTLTLTSTGAGGKGLSADSTLTVSGSAVITVVTSGQAVVASSTGTLSIISNSSTLDRYDSDYKCSPKGIKIDGDIIINGGTISVTTSGAGGEGIESKKTLTVNDGHITVNAFDDGINSTGDMTINGGYIFAKGAKNDAMDANGNMYVKGGLIYAIGATSPEVALDANTEEGKKLYITGGTIIAVGNLEGGAQISGGTCKYTTSWTGNSWYALYNGSDLVAAFQTPSKSSSGSYWAPAAGPGGDGGSQKLVVYTSSTPTLKSNVSVSDGTEYFGGLANIGGTVTGGSSVTLSNYTSSGGGPGNW